MKILITNDDGLNTNGMLHLEEALAELGEVWAIAPDRERSATSMALSIRDTLRLTKMGERRYMLTGFPADCVNVALFTEGFPKFDLVVSGINHGVNLGDDIHYSGTVGAARHAALHGIPAIAVSCPIREHDGDFRRAAVWVKNWIKNNIENISRDVVYNINYPLEDEISKKGSFPEERLTSQGKRIYLDAYQVIEQGTDYSVMHMKDTGMGHVEEEGSDFDLLEKGFVSITPLLMLVTDHKEKERWKIFSSQNLKK